MVVRNRSKKVELVFNHADSVNSSRPEIMELERQFRYNVNELVPKHYLPKMIDPAEVQYRIVVVYNDNIRQRGKMFDFKPNAYKTAEGVTVHEIVIFSNAYKLGTTVGVVSMVGATALAVAEATGFQIRSKTRVNKKAQELLAEMKVIATETDKAHGLSNLQATADLVSLIIGELKPDETVFTLVAAELPERKKSEPSMPKVKWSCSCESIVSAIQGDDLTRFGDCSVCKSPLAIVS